MREEFLQQYRAVVAQRKARESELRSLEERVGIKEQMDRVRRGTLNPLDHMWLPQLSDEKRDRAEERLLERSGRWIRDQTRSAYFGVPDLEVRKSLIRLDRLLETDAFGDIHVRLAAAQAEVARGLKLPLWSDVAIGLAALMAIGFVYLASGIGLALVAGVAVASLVAYARREGLKGREAEVRSAEADIKELESILRGERDYGLTFSSREEATGFPDTGTDGRQLGTGRGDDRL